MNETLKQQVIDGHQRTVQDEKKAKKKKLPTNISFTLQRFFTLPSRVQLGSVSLASMFIN
jgi:hypothetical protein